MTEEDLMWFAAYVSPRKEFLADQVLSSNGYKTYLPLENQARRISRRCRRTDLFRVPLLPGYLFVGVKAPHELSGLFGWSFVLHVLGDDAPRQIAPVEMIYIRKMAEERCKVPARLIDWAPNRGEWVRITSGPWAILDQKVKVEALIGKKAKKFFAELNGRLVTIETKNVVAA